MTAVPVLNLRQPSPITVPEQHGVSVNSAAVSRPSTSGSVDGARPGSRAGARSRSKTRGQTLQNKRDQGRAPGVVVNPIKHSRSAVSLHKGKELHSVMCEVPKRTAIDPAALESTVGSLLLITVT